MASVQTARFVTIALAENITGYSKDAIQTKIARGVWTEGREWRRAPDGRVLIDIRGYEKWVENQSLAAYTKRAARSDSTFATEASD